jgi:hypothetical protein
MGQTLVLIATGAQTYSWSNGATLSILPVSPTVTTTYSVIGTTSAGCSSSAIHNLTVYALPSITVSAIPSQTICADQSATLVATGISVDTYSWNTGSNAPLTVVSPTATSTDYTVVAGNNFTGCQNTKVISIAVKPCTGIEELNKDLVGLAVFPNPNGGQFNVQLINGSSKTVEVLDATGRIVLKIESAEDLIKIDLENKANGLYMVKVTSNNEIGFIRVVKQ